MSVEIKSKNEISGLDATDLEEVRGSLRDSVDQYKLSDDELDGIAGGGRTFGGWDVSNVKSAGWDVGRVKSDWDVSGVVAFNG